MSFKTYCWSLGTTSFRVADLKFKIESQLRLLTKLFEENPGESWRTLQVKYFDLLVEAGLSVPNPKTTKDALAKKAKDARQKSSSLVNLGLITDDRKVTKVGEKVLEIFETMEFDNDNIFFIRNDSFLYLKQLLKYEIDGRDYNEFNIKPIVSIIYAISQMGHLTEEEFTFLLPLCKNTNEVIETVELIKELRQQKTTISSILRHRILSMDNYKELLNTFLSSPTINLDLMEELNCDRKSSTYASQIYLNLYNEILKYFTMKNSLNTFDKQQVIFDCLTEIKKMKNDKVKRIWSQLFKRTGNYPTKPNQITNVMISAFENSPLMQTQSINMFKKHFFLMLHETKWRATLEDYYDLNKRFLGLTDVFLFEENQIKLDIIPSHYFKDIAVKMLNEENILPQNEAAYYQKYRNEQDKLEDISPIYRKNLTELVENLEVEYPELVGTSESDLSQAISNLITDKKIQRFNNLIAKYFKKDQLLELFENINQDNRSAIIRHCDWDTDVPTIFEYLIAIVWYEMSQRSINIAKALNMSLDANLLPRRFASGGQGDILYSFTDHDVLLEVTLTNAVNQRRAEMEPVPRHLAQHLFANPNDKSYAVFIANTLDPNVLVNFRSAAKQPYYSTNGLNKVDGLKIIPLDISNIKYIIKNDVTYNDFYRDTHIAFMKPETDGFTWYNNRIKPLYS